MDPRPFATESDTCRAVQRDWAARPLRDQLRPVREFRHLVAESAGELTSAVEADVGRPPMEVLGSDVLPLADACRFLETNAGRLLKPRKIRGTPIWLFGQRDVVHRRPLGVVAVIGTWNYPLLLNGVQLVQALAAGNGVLWKPSELGTRSAAVLTRLVAQAGFPPGLLQTLPAERDAGPRLLEADIDHLVFTGSAAVGRLIARRLGERLIPSTLELSGCDALFVLDDADVALAADAAWFGINLNKSQTCLAVRRLFVDRTVASEFESRLRQLVESASPAALATPGQALQAERLVEDAVKRGGTPVGNAGGPRVILNASPEMEVCRVDCFAPLAAVIAVDSVEQALELEAQCPFALGSAVFTRDVGRAEAIAARLRPGSVCVNDVIAPTAHPAVPFGGRADSGWGVTRGAEGLLAMTVPQVVSVRGGRFRPHYAGPTPALGALLDGVLAWSHGRTLRRRLAGLAAAVRNAPRLGGNKNAGA